MKNNLNKKNNSISGSSQLSNNTNKKKSKKKSKISRENTTKILNNSPYKNELFQVENSRCLGPCYPANTTYYHPLTLQSINNKFSSCPTKSIKVNGQTQIFDECIVNDNFDYKSYDIFADIFDLASTDNLFLEQIYKIKNINDVILFLDNEINELPILSQKRIINSIYKVYRDDDIFPNNKYIECLQNILNSRFNLNVSSKKILNIIMKNKHKTIYDDIFEKIKQKINS